MKPYSLDFREKVVKAYEKGDTSGAKVSCQIRSGQSFRAKNAENFNKKKVMSNRENFLGGMKSTLEGQGAQLASLVEEYPDATLCEYCEYWGETYHQWVSTSTMCRALQREQLTRKKRRYAARKLQPRGCKRSGVTTVCKCCRSSRKT